MKPSILVVGCGNMGSAFVKGFFLDNWHSKYEFFLYDVIYSKADFLAKELKIKALPNLNVLDTEPYLAILAVKPNQIESVCKKLHRFKKAIFLSLAAGISQAQLQKYLGQDHSIVRVMPNLGVEVGEGVVALNFNSGVNEENRENLLILLSSLGWVFEAEEKEFDQITALSGSGPGFIAVFIESMMDAGVNVGLSWEKSLQLSIQTMLGTTAWLKKRNCHPGILKNMVCSPGGTTITGIKRLELAGFRGIIMDGIEAASKRTKNNMAEE